MTGWIMNREYKLAERNLEIKIRELKIKKGKHGITTVSRKPASKE